MNAVPRRIPVPAFLLLFVLLAASPLAADPTSAVESRRAVENLVRERASAAERADREGSIAASQAEGFTMQAEEARLAAASASDSAEIVRLARAERIAIRRSQLASLRARLSADRLRRVEADLAHREFELERLVNRASRDQVMLEIEESPPAEERIEEVRAAARVTWDELMLRLRIAGTQKRQVDSEVRRAAAGRERLELALLRLEAQGSRAVESPDLVRENRGLLVELVEGYGEDERELALLAAHLAAHRAALLQEVRSYTDFDDELGRRLIEARVRALFTPSGGVGFSHVGVALALALAIYLLLHVLRRAGAARAGDTIAPARVERRRNAAIGFLAFALLLVLTALAVALGYVPLAAYILPRGLATLAVLVAAGWGARRLLRAGFSRHILRNLVILGVVVAVTAMTLAWIWGISLRPSLILLFRYSMPRMRRIVSLGGLCILVAAFLYAAQRIVSAVVRIVTRPSHRDGSDDYERRFDTVEQVLRRVTTVVVLLAGTLLILREFGFDVMPLLAGAGIAGIALGLGAQSLVKDFLSGFFILMENQYRVGDVIRIGDRSGQVEQFGLRTTVLRGLDGIVHIIPNGEITSVSNMTHEWSRCVLDIDVAYESDLGKVQATLVDVGRALKTDETFGPLILEEPQVLGVEAFKDSSICVRVLVKTRPMKQWDVAREMRLRIKRAFDHAGIEIPFPQRVVHTRESSS